MNPVTSRFLSTITGHKEILFLFLLTCLFFSPVIIHYDEMIYPPGNVAGNDITGIGSFYRSFFGSAISQNHQGIPLWNPHVFSGTPYIGNPQTQIFCPFLWPFLITDSPLLFGWICMLEVFLIGLFTFFFARSIRLSRYASFLAAVSFMFSGTIILRIYAGHLAILETLVWFPLVLLFFERSFTGNRTINAALAGVVMALMLFGGNFQVALYGIVVCGLYLVIRTFLFPTISGHREKLVHVAVVGLVCISICAMLAAIQVLPTWEFSQLSNRAGEVSYSFSTVYSLPPENLATLIVPDLFGTPFGPMTETHINPPVSIWEWAFYCGILTLILTVIAILFRRDRYVGLFAFLALFSLFFSFGDYSPLYSLFFDFVPGFSTFRVPARMLFIFTFALAILAGWGADTIFENRTVDRRNFLSIISRQPVRRGLILLAAAAGILLPALFLTGVFGQEYYLPAIFGWTSFVALFCIAPWLLETPSESRTTLVKILLVSILIADLFFFGMRFIDTRSPAEVFREPGYIPVIANESDTYFRVYDETEFLNQHQYIAYRNNLHLVGGYDPVYLKEYQTYFTHSQEINYSGSFLWMQGSVITDFDILRSLNVRYIITSRYYDRDFDVPGLQCVYANDSVRVYRLNVTAPRAYVIPAAEFGNRTPVSLQPAGIEHYSPNTILVNVTTTEPGYLILSEVWYPGWTAMDNGRATTVERYRDIFRAVRLDPGNHMVSFSYFPKILTV